MYECQYLRQCNEKKLILNHLIHLRINDFNLYWLYIGLKFEMLFNQLHLITVITTTNIEVVLFVSLIFFVSFDSPPRGFTVFVTVAEFPEWLVAADTHLVFNNFSRFLSASRIARNSNMFRITNARHGNI